MFITLTYDNYNIPVNDDGFPTLQRSDVSKFLKAYKRKYGLDNETFQYFGCGEYGENYRRPHYHLLFFGDYQLYEDFFRDTDSAQKRLTDVWKFGFVHIGMAGFDGIHYVTKYVLKDDLEWLPDSVVNPFTIASKGLGMNFLKTTQAEKFKERLRWLHYHVDKVYSSMPEVCYDGSNLDEVILYLQKYIPKFEVILDDGRKIFLPRAIRRKLIGSFEHFKDSPLWLYIHLLQLRDSIQYYKTYGDYDLQNDVNMSYQKCLNRVEKINKRLLENKFNKKIKVL